MLKIFTIIAIAVIIALLWISVLPAFSQFSVYSWDVDFGTAYDSNGDIYLTNDNLAYHKWNPKHLDIIYYVNLHEFGCLNDDSKKDSASVERQEEERLIMKYTDLFNNTVKIYCQYNAFSSDDERVRQYTAIYNDKILVGLCPYDSAVNRHQIQTNEEGKIIGVHWLSVRTDGSDYVIYNNYFGP